MKRLLFASLLFLVSFLADAVAAQLLAADEPSFSVELAEVLPETEFDSAIKSPEAFFGFPLGSRHLRHHQLIDYATYLAEISDRIRLVSYGKTHGGRPLTVLMVGQEIDEASLEELAASRQARVNGQAGENDKTVAYFGYSIHGDEASGANAFPAVAYYLAASSDPLVTATLQNSILLLDPSLNPDGGDRFANWVNESRGRFASPSELDREHNQPWPGGRSNYYWFDLNRDWLPTVHPESVGRVQLFHLWKPNVLLDFHEMGSGSSYFFQPGIPARNNPLTPERVFELTKSFATEHAKSLDSAGELYFTEERFDDFYMGKGSTYPDLHGAIGILFEQGSTRGLVSKNDRYQRTFADTVANQIRTSISSLRAIDRLHDELLEHQSNFYSEAMSMAKESAIRAYILHADGDVSRVSAAAELLARHDIDCWQPSKSITVDGRVFGPGSVAIIPTDQPEFRFIESLMQRQQQFKENIFYDVSAWTLPLAFDLETIGFRGELPEAWSAEDKPEESGQNLPEAAEAIAYAIDPVSLDAPTLIAELLTANIQVRVGYEPFVATNTAGQEVELRRGTWLVLKPGNEDAWARVGEIIGKASSAKNLIIESIKTGLTAKGPDLGSDDNKWVPKANVLLVVGEGTSSLDAGALWHFLDQRLALPTTLVEADSIGRAKLDEYSCIVMPGGSYGGWNDSTAAKLRAYVSGGGTIVAVDSAIGWLRSRELIAVKKSDGPVESGSAEVEPAEPMTFSGAADRAALERIAGAIFETSADVTHPLAFGFPDNKIPVFRDSTTVYPLSDNSFATASGYGEVMAGYVSQKNRERLQGSAAVWAENVGSGRIICIADNPVFRGYFRAAERFLTNAILLGPTLRIPSGLIDDEDDGHGH